MLNQSDHYEPGTALISLFGTKGYRILPEGPFSTRPSHFPGGETVYVRKDDGDRLLIERRGETYDTHRGDWAPLPDAHTVAWLLVNNSINENALEGVKAERETARVALGSALEALGEVTAERDALKAEQARWQAEGRDYETILAERDEYREIADWNKRDGDAKLAQALRERDAANACIASLHRRAVAATEALGIVYAPEGYVDSPDAPDAE